MKKILNKIMNKNEIRDMKITDKLKFSFQAVLRLMVIVFAIGVIGMFILMVANRTMYNSNVLPLVTVGQIETSFNETATLVRNMVIYDRKTTSYLTTVTALKSAEANFQEHLEVYETLVSSAAEREMYNNIRNLFTRWQGFTHQMWNYTSQGRTDEALHHLNSTGNEITREFSTTIKEIVEYKKDAAARTLTINLLIFVGLTVIIGLVLAYAIWDSLRIAKNVSNDISSPLEILSGFMRRAGSTGDISHSDDERQGLQMWGQAKDEIGQIISDIDHFMEHVTHIADELELLASGDLTTEIEILSNEDIMGQSVKHVVDRLNSVFLDLNASSTQVSLGASQIADAASSLAEGATAQAMSVKHLSETIGAIADKTKDNAAIADKTANHAGLIQSKAEEGRQQMEDMIAAVEDINVASKAISEVIKTISGIASKTNILSLNAAVEAARAGEHGKGFAVVADEVRKLAAQSTEAVHHTATLIQNSIDKAGVGRSLAMETSESLIEIVNLIQESTGFINEIAKGSEEQSVSITQINNEIDQVLEVVESNSATSEESAAFSQQMSAQASVLEEMVAKFKLKGN